MQHLLISTAQPEELSAVGHIMAEEYSRLDGFPSREDQPAYYKQFSVLDVISSVVTTDVVVAKDQHNTILGGVVFFSDMQGYGAGGNATTSIKNAAAIRWLAVTSYARGKGIGRKLTEHCVELARQLNKSRLILHTTQHMPAAWGLYTSMGFTRFEAIDFTQDGLDVFGFQLVLTP